MNQTTQVFQTNRNGNPPPPLPNASGVVKGLMSKLLQANAEAVAQLEAAEIREKQYTELFIQKAATQAASLVILQIQSLQRALTEMHQAQSQTAMVLQQVAAYMNGDRREKSEEIRRLTSDRINEATCTPMLRELCQEAKAAVKGQAELRGHPSSMAREAGITILETQYLSIVERLSDHRVVSFSVESGARVDPAKCEPVRRRKIPTNNEKLVGHVAEVESPGFIRGEEIIEKCSVFVFELESTNHKESL